MFTIHFVHEKDLPALMDLYHQLTGQDQNTIAIHAGFKQIQGDDHYYLFGVYDENDALIATASLTKCFDLTDDALDYYNLENFVVDEKVRGRGVGAFLLNAVEDFVQKQGGRYINFTSAAERTEAHRFYEKMGYAPEKTKGFKKVFVEENG